MEVATSTSALVQTWDATGARILRADPELLYSVRTGDGVGEFGMEECGECDPARPWAPIVDSQNRILVADAVNRRWLHIDVATVTSVPFPGDEVVVGLAFGPNDIVYSLTVLYENGQQAHWMLNVLQSPIGPIGLENQSVFVEGVDDASSAAPQFVGYELTSDGTAVGVWMPGGSDALNGGLFVDERGIVRLRHDLDADRWREVLA